MQVVRTKSVLQEILQTWRLNGAKIGFVPTMGALHEGHLSLVKMALEENDNCVVSIFVNPTQFNERSDYQSYPREESKDIRMLEQCGADLVFIPEEKEMYDSPVENLVEIDLEGLDMCMEGAFRPGHFKGVVTIVDKLFRLISPNRAYFGQKDFQQLSIIRLLARKCHPEVAIISCPIIRESSGLAMSSRNQLLDETERIKASAISRALYRMGDQIQKLPIQLLKEDALGILREAGEPEYLEIVDRDSLQVIEKVGSRPLVICTAVRVGKVRLIDNVEIPSTNSELFNLGL